MCHSSVFPIVSKTSPLQTSTGIIWPESCPSFKSVRINPLQRRTLIFFPKFYFVSKRAIFQFVRVVFKTFLKASLPFGTHSIRKIPFLLVANFFLSLYFKIQKKKRNRITSSDGCWTDKSIRKLYNSPCVFVVFDVFFSLSFIIRERAQQQIKSIRISILSKCISLCCVCNAYYICTQL